MVSVTIIPYGQKICGENVWWIAQNMAFGEFYFGRWANINNHNDLPKW